jgi:peroxiredoxin Q/BCP
MLNIGDKAPDFTLKDKNGNDVSLSGFLGKKVVLYFYPKDNTPGCTRQACAFAAAYEGFKSKDIVVIGDDTILVRRGGKRC